jgi:hypothetical protein
LKHHTSMSNSFSAMLTISEHPLSFIRSSPTRPTPGQSNLTYQLATQSQVTSNDYIIAQPGNPIATGLFFPDSSNPAASSENLLPFSPQYSYFQPLQNGCNFDQDQEVSIPIKRTARHSRSPYSYGSSVTSRLKLGSSSSMTYGSLQGGSYTTTPTLGAGFSLEQIPAAQAILQFITDRPGEAISSHLINDQLVEISGGYCLIGNCRTELEKQRCNPESVPSKDIISSKRADHLYDHIRNKHFNYRPFRCIQWYARLSTQSHPVYRPLITI